MAVDAAEKVVVDYDPLPAVVDLEDALTDEVLLHDDLGTNKSYFFSMPTGADVDETFAGADVVVKRRFLQQRLLPTPLEPRATACLPSAASGEFVLYSSTQVPHILRLMIAATTGIPEQKIRVVAPDVGGGFGSKLQVYGEELVSVLVARRLGRPVKWTETRSESFLTMHHGRGQIQDIEIAATNEGKLLGLKVDLIADMGAYLMLVTPGIPILGAFMYPAIYKMDAYRFNCTGVFTNKTPTDAYRGAGRPEATFAIERIMDELAVELGMEPMELRRKNWIAHDEFPFETVAGLTYDSGNYEAATDRAMELFDYAGLRAEQADRGSAATRSSSASASRRSPRCAAWRRHACWATSASDPVAGRPPPCGCWPPERSRWSRARHPTGRGTRPRGHRSRRRRWGFRSRTSRCSTATRRCPQWASTPTGRARWPSVASPSTRQPRR